MTSVHIGSSGFAAACARNQSYLRPGKSVRNIGDQAKGQSQENLHREQVDESSFRYPGPKPQSKEAGVLMLADSVEGASRSLVDPTPARIESIVEDIAMKRLLDSGSLDQDDSKRAIQRLQASDEAGRESLAMLMRHAELTGLGKTILGELQAYWANQPGN